MYEGGVFNTEALKMSVRRLNQLGYFKPIEDQKHIQIDKAPQATDKVDLTLKLEEQNRNQINFGAGMSQIGGVFVNRSFSTTNFLGKGETLAVAVETGSRSNNYQASLTEPYIFNRPDLARRKPVLAEDELLLHVHDPEYSEVREGATVTMGMALRSFSRLFSGYTYEIVDSRAAGALLTDGSSVDRRRNGDKRYDDHHHHLERNHDLHAHERHPSRPSTTRSIRGAMSKAASNRRSCSTPSTAPSRRGAACASPSDHGSPAARSAARSTMSGRTPS